MTRATKRRRTPAADADTPRPRRPRRTDDGRPALAGGYVLQLRARTGLTQQAFAEALGISSVTVSRWEQDRFPLSDTSTTLLGLLDRALQSGRTPSEVTGALRNAKNGVDRTIILAALGAPAAPANVLPLPPV